MNYVRQGLAWIAIGLIDLGIILFDNPDTIAPYDAGISWKLIALGTFNFCIALILEDKGEFPQ